MSYVFISYARAERPTAEQLVRDLRANELKTWGDTRSNLDSAQDYTGKIEAAIRRAAAVVVCLTKDEVDRQDRYMRREIAYALAKEKHIIPVIFPGGELPVLLNSFTPVRMETGTRAERSLQSLIDRIRREPPVAPLPHYLDPPELIDYLNNLHEYASNRLQQSLHTLLTSDNPRALRRAAPTFEFDFGVAPILSTHNSLTFHSFKEILDYHEGRMVLQGAPGCGKTTTLLAAARDAAVERINDPRAPIPIMASLYKWDFETPLVIWAQKSLQEAGVDSSQPLIYLLDGLEEIGGHWLPAEDTGKLLFDPVVRFIETLNQEIQDAPVVITSRPEAIESLSQKLPLPGIVTLQPLSDYQIVAYLKAREQEDLAELIMSDPYLAVMARTPLMLSLLSIAYEHDARESPPDLSDMSEALIIDRYIDRRFWLELSPIPLAFNQDTTRVYLGRLAAQMWRDQAYPRMSLPMPEAKKALGPQAEAFIRFGQRMHFLQFNQEGEIQFIHPKVRDFCMVQFFLNALRYGNKGSRQDAVRALGQIQDNTAVPGLLVALNDHDPEIRLMAIQALGKISDITAISNLLDVLHDENEDVREAAAASLGQFTRDSAIPDLLEALRDEHPLARTFASSALRQVGARATPGLIEALHDEDSRVRWRAAMALGQIADASAVAALKEALQDSFYWVRISAAKALGKIGSPEAVQNLLDALQDTDSGVRRAAADALGTIGEPAETALIYALEDKNFYVRKSAAEALETIDSENAQEALKEWRTNPQIASGLRGHTGRLNHTGKLGHTGSLGMGPLKPKRLEEIEAEMEEEG